MYTEEENQKFIKEHLTIEFDKIEANLQFMYHQNKLPIKHRVTDLTDEEIEENIKQLHTLRYKYECAIRYIKTLKNGTAQSNSEEDS